MDGFLDGDAVGVPTGDTEGDEVTTGLLGEAVGAVEGDADDKVSPASEGFLDGLAVGFCGSKACNSESEQSYIIYPEGKQEFKMNLRVADKDQLLPKYRSTIDSQNALVQKELGYNKTSMEMVGIDKYCCSTPLWCLQHRLMLPMNHRALGK